MYSNQRQKKRSSQFRKKYHDSRSKGKEGETSKQPQKQQNKPPQPVKDEARRTDETSCQGIVRNAAKVSHTGTGPDDEAVKHEHKKYARRKVVSNWDRYGDVGADEGEGRYQESEEELQQRLIQLLNLPSAPPSETPLTENVFQPSHLDKNSFLSLDCSALAEAFSSLPLHKRLDISLELLELATDTSQGTESLAPDGADSVDLAAACSSKSLQKTVDQFVFQVPAPEAPRTSGGGSGGGSGGDSSSLHNSTNILVNTSEQGVTLPDSRMGAVQDITSVADGDKELDKLLAAKTQPERTSRGCGKDLGQVTSHTSNTTPHPGVSDSPPAADPNTAELDDMLDELLA